MARPATGKIPPQQLMHIRPRHRQIMYRLVAGEKQVDIALELDITTTRLSIIVNSPLFKAEYKKVEDKVLQRMIEKRSDITNRVERLQPSALSVIEDIMKGKTTGKALKRQCANDILELGQKRRRAEVDDGLNPFARVIAEAFKIAKEKHEQSSNGVEEPVIEVDSMLLNSETGLPVDPPEDHVEEHETKMSKLNENVTDVLGEMGIIDLTEVNVTS